MTDHNQQGGGREPGWEALEILRARADNQQGGGREPGWEALEILRARAREAEARRDESIAALRQEMGDKEVLDEFGIDLSRLED